MKKVISLLFVVSLMIGLAACSNDEDKKKDTTTKKSEMKVSEMMQEDKQHVWFVLSDTETNELEDESKINRAIVTKNGKMKVYKMTEGITISSIVDNEIFTTNELIDTQDKAEFNGNRDNYIRKTKDAIKNTKAYMNEDENYNNVGMNGIAQTKEEDDDIPPEKTLNEQEKYLQELKETKYSKPKWQKVNLKVMKNGKEAIKAKRNYGFPESKSSTGDKTDAYPYFVFNQGYQPVPFGNDEERFAGLSHKNEDDDFNDQSPYLITKINDDVQTVIMDEKDDTEIKHEKYTDIY